MYEANQRQGTVAKKSPRQVEGSTRKIYKQKHTGNARMGSVRRPSAGAAAAPSSRSRGTTRKDMPEKMRRLARANALLAKLVDQQVKVVDGLAFDAPKTKQFTQVLKALQVDGGDVSAGHGQAR